MAPVDEDSAVGSDIVAWCLSKKDGKVLWKKTIPGRYNTKLSAPFADASSPAPLTDGETVWFLNPTGRLVAMDLEGNEKWSTEVTSVSRTRPALFDGKILLHQQNYLPNETGKFSGP